MKAVSSTSGAPCSSGAMAATAATAADAGLVLCHVSSAFFNIVFRLALSNLSACRGISLASIYTFRISDFKNFADKITSGSMPIFSFYF